jgi:hypothetical protein
MTSHVFLRSRRLEGQDAEGFVEAYLEAIELQRRHTRSAPCSGHLSLPPQVRPIERVRAPPVVLISHFVAPTTGL